MSYDWYNNYKKGENLYIIRCQKFKIIIYKYLEQFLNGEFDHICWIIKLSTSIYKFWKRSSIPMTCLLMFYLKYCYCQH